MLQNHLGYLEFAGLHVVKIMSLMMIYYQDYLLNIESNHLA